jgi:hypothetical protein
MKYRGIIPDQGNFDITEECLQDYISIYGELNAKSNARYDKIFARKLAGLNLLNHI